MRTCKVCEIEKPLSEFPSNMSQGYFYILNTCTLCQKAKNRERGRDYREANREKVRERGREGKRDRYENDLEFREEAKARAREYYQRNREKILAKKRKRNRCASSSPPSATSGSPEKP